jgi:hypothetical protein
MAGSRLQFPGGSWREFGYHLPATPLAKLCKHSVRG